MCRELMARQSKTVPCRRVWRNTAHVFASTSTPRSACASGFLIRYLFACRETSASGFRVTGVSVSQPKPQSTTSCSG